MVDLSVIKEQATLNRVETESFARYGDGELKLMHGEDSLSQKWNDEVAEELKMILCNPKCYIGMPYAHPQSPRKKYWKAFMATHSKYLSAAGDYGSSFITRFDEAPWIDTSAYRKQMMALWVGMDVVLVRGQGSLKKDMLFGAKSVQEVICPAKDAYRMIDKIEAKVGTPPFAIFCLGATATCLVNRLAPKGVHGIDLGYVGRFL